VNYICSSGINDASIKRDVKYFSKWKLWLEEKKTGRKSEPAEYMTY